MCVHCERRRLRKYAKTRRLFGMFVFSKPRDPRPHTRFAQTYMPNSNTIVVAADNGPPNSVEIINRVKSQHHNTGCTACNYFARHRSVHSLKQLLFFTILNFKKKTNFFHYSFDTVFLLYVYRNPVRTNILFFFHTIVLKPIPCLSSFYFDFLICLFFSFFYLYH